MTGRQRERRGSAVKGMIGRKEKVLQNLVPARRMVRPALGKRVTQRVINLFPSVNKHDVVATVCRMSNFIPAHEFYNNDQKRYKPAFCQAELFY